MPFSDSFKRFQEWLQAGGGDQVMTGLRQLMAAGIVIRPQLEWIKQQQASNPMWFLLEDLMHAWEEERWLQLLFLAGQQEDTLLDALRAVLVDEGGANVVRDAVRQLPESTYASRHVIHGLEHLQRGDYADAWPPLLVGLEGLIRQHAAVAGVVDIQGRTASGHRPGVEGVYKALGIPTYYERFLQRRVYAGTGHPFAMVSRTTGSKLRWSVQRSLCAAGLSSSVTGERWML